MWLFCLAFRALSWAGEHTIPIPSCVSRDRVSGKVHLYRHISQHLSTSPPKKNTHTIPILRIGTQDSRRFVYAPCASRFCYEHDLILYGPWAGFVKRALRLPKVGGWVE